MYCVLLPGRLPPTTSMRAWPATTTRLAEMFTRSVGIDFLLTQVLLARSYTVFTCVADAWVPSGSVREPPMMWSLLFSTVLPANARFDGAGARVVQAFVAGS